MASSVARAYIVWSGGYVPSGVEVQSPWSGVKGLRWKQVKNYVINIALWISVFDRLVFTDISSMTAHLLYAATYAANAKTHIGLSGGKTNLLESRFGGDTFFSHVWGYLWQPPCSLPWCEFNSFRTTREKRGWAFSWISRSAGPCPHSLHSWCGRTS